MMHRLQPFEFNEIDDLCISARLKVDVDPRIEMIRDSARNCISHSEIPFAAYDDAISDLAHITCKLIEQGGFKKADNNDVALVVALLTIEYRRMPVVDKGLTYEDVFKACYNQYWTVIKSSLSVEEISKIENEIDDIIRNESMYNTYLFMEDCLNAAFQVMRRVQTKRIDYAREISRYIDSKRDATPPRGEIWRSIVMKILINNSTLHSAINNDSHLDAEEDLHIHDTCQNEKKVDYTDGFLLELFDAFIKNERDYHIRDIIEPLVIRNSNDNPILFYDRRDNIIVTDNFFTTDYARVPIYCLGTVHDYLNSFLNVIGLNQREKFFEFYKLFDISDKEEKQISAIACISIDKAAHCVFDVTPNDNIVSKAHVYFVRRWLDFKVNLNECSSQKVFDEIGNICDLSNDAFVGLPESEKVRFETELEKYFATYAAAYGNNFFDYLEVSIPILEDFNAKKSFAKEAYSKILIDYYFYRTREQLSAEKRERISRILSQRHSMYYYLDTIASILDEGQ